jgi:hypothetical protein
MSYKESMVEIGDLMSKGSSRNGIEGDIIGIAEEGSSVTLQGGAPTVDTIGIIEEDT